MLTRLRLQHFTFIDHLALDFEPGFTVFTGETGAGKSLLFEALWQVLGARADSALIQAGQPTCTICAQFDLQALPAIQHWLLQHGLAHARPICHLQRKLTCHARSQAFINDKPVSLPLLRALGRQLVTLHGQHQSQQLLKPEHQRRLLDSAGDCLTLAEAIEAHYEQLKGLQRQSQQLAESLQAKQSRVELMQYQKAELETLALQPGELTQLDLEQRRLAHAHEILDLSHHALALLEEAEPAPLLGSLHKVQQSLKHLTTMDPGFEAALASLNQASIHLLDSCTELRAQLKRIHLDPERLQAIEQRLSQIHTLARKHQIQPDALLALQARLSQDSQQRQQAEQGLAALQQQAVQALAEYQTTARRLTVSRRQTADWLNHQLTEYIQALGMAGGRFEIQLHPLDPDTLTRYGHEQPSFALAAAPGQALQALAQCASGGELSRLSLAIQTILAERSHTPLGVFDEVDAGIGGGIAERVGRLLREMSQKRQVLCITHLPQVAALGQQHYCIRKSFEQGTVHTEVRPLTGEERIQELARMLGGMQISAQTVAHAQEMLRQATAPSPV